MKFLFLDTTQDWVHIALFEQSKEKQTTSVSEFAQYLSRKPKESSHKLISKISEMFHTNSLEKPDGIIVCTGPGSFTGLRIGVTTARTLVQFWQIPFLSVTSNSLYALSMPELSTLSSKILICLDGKQGKYYSNFFNGDHFSDIYDTLDPMELAGEKNWNFDHLLYYGNKKENFPTNSHVIIPENFDLSKGITHLLVNSQWQTDYSSLLPNYIRESYVAKK